MESSKEIDERESLYTNIEEDLSYVTWKLVVCSVTNGSPCRFKIKEKPDPWKWQATDPEYGNSCQVLPTN